MDVLQDLRYALRRLGRSPGFAFVVIATLALGIGALTAVFSVVDAVLLRGLPYDGADRLVSLAEARASSARSEKTTSFLNAEDFAKAKSLDALGLARPWNPTLTGLGDAERLDAALVTAGIFDVFRIAPRLGRAFRPSDALENAENVAVVSDGFWKTRLGSDPAVVGRRLTINAQPFTVVGVLPRGFRGPHELEAGFWANYTHDPHDSRSARNLRGYGRLREGVSLEAAASELAGISARLAALDPEANRGLVATLRPLKSELAGDTARPLALVLGSAALLLAIACANLSNLLLARGAAREAELTVRAALGASRARLLRQLLTESFLLAAAGAAAGLLLAGGVTRLLLGLAPETLKDRAVSLDARTLAFTSLLAVATTLLFGLLPALRLARADIQTALRATAGSVIRGGVRTRSTLAVAQLALALSLAVVAGLLLKSFARLSEVNPGFAVDHLLTAGVNLPGAPYPEPVQAPFYERLVARVERLPGVSSAAVASIVPFSSNFDRVSLDIVGEETLGADKPEADRYIVSPSFFETLRVPLREGRLFTTDDRADTPGVAIVDEVFARRLARGKSALGTRVHVPGPVDSVATVVGVVGHVKQYGPDVDSQGQVYFAHAQRPWRWMVLALRTSVDPLSLTGPVRGAVKELDPQLAVFATLSGEQLLSERTALRRFTLTLVAAFSALAVSLAVLGLYGVVSYLVALRRREAAIRMALGARPAAVLRLFLAHGAALAACGVAAGLAATLALARLVSGLLFQVSALDPATLALSAALLASTALAASLLPAWRATRVDPIAALRTE